MSNTPPADPDTARRLLDAGVAASRANDPQRAFVLFAQAEAAAPGWALPHFVMASEHASAGDWAKAEAEFAVAVLLDPGMRVARYQLGLLQFSAGRAAVAQVTWQPLADPVQPDGLGDFVRGFAALAADDFAAARTAFDAGLARTEVNPAVADDIRQILANMPAAAASPAPAQMRAPLMAAEPEPPPLAHVLVANYDRFKLH